MAGLGSSAQDATSSRPLEFPRERRAVSAFSADRRPGVHFLLVTFLCASKEKWRPTGKVHRASRRNLHRKLARQ